MISTESTSIHPNDWEDDGLRLPFELIKAIFRFDSVDDDPQSILYSMESNDNNIFDDFIDCCWISTKNSVKYGVLVKFQQPRSFDMTITLKLKLFSRTVRPIIIPE